MSVLRRSARQREASEIPLIQRVPSCKCYEQRPYYNRNQLLAQVTQSWRATMRYCLIVIVTTGTPAIATWLMVKVH
jgi:hypothetical protein